MTAWAPKAIKAHDLPPPGPPAISPKSPCPNPPQRSLFIRGHGVSTTLLASSLNLSSNSVIYSCPISLSVPAFNALSIKFLISS